MEADKWSEASIELMTARVPGVTLTAFADFGVGIGVGADDKSERAHSVGVGVHYGPLKVERLRYQSGGHAETKVLFGLAGM